MLIKKSVTVLLMFFLSVIMSSCGTTGVTKPFSVNLNNTGEPITKKTSIGLFEIEQNATNLTAVGTFRWGKFNQNDLDVLKMSLNNTISKIAPNKTKDQRPELIINTIIRYYMVASSNKGGAVLACVAWCATDEANNIIFHEQFYSAETVRFIGTLGGLKNDVNESIIERIASSILKLAQSSKTALPITTERTYNSYEEAVKNVPKTMRSWSIGVPFGNGYSSSVIIPTGGSSAKIVNWDWAKRPNNINWGNRLKSMKQN